MMLRRIDDISIEDAGNYEALITVYYEPTWLGKIFGIGGSEVRLIGSGTVWHYFPSWNWAGYGWEGFCYPIWNKWNHKKKAPKIYE